MGEGCLAPPALAHLRGASGFVGEGFTQRQGAGVDSVRQLLLHGFVSLGCLMDPAGERDWSCQGSMGSMGLGDPCSSGWP